jgi:uncharacterized protein
MSLTSEQITQIKQKYNAESNKPLVVAVLGQTGVGKTSLINALFGVDLPTGNVMPVTKAPEQIKVRDSTNNDLIFWDMPGIGESSESDQRYISEYQRVLSEADVAIWAVHADSRSVTFDITSLRSMLSGLSASQQSSVVSKLIFVLTKVDLVNPKPWIAAKTKQTVSFAEPKETLQLLNEKAMYFRQALLTPFSNLLVTSAKYKGRKINIGHPNVTLNDNILTYQGLMDVSQLEDLKEAFPTASQALEEIYESTVPVFCSSHLRFNLTQVMSVIAQRISPQASVRLRKFIDSKSLNQVSWTKAKTFSNIVVFDTQIREVIFDINHMG